MKKRLLGTLLAAALVVTQAVSVFAAGSKTTQATPSGDSVGKYEMTEGTKENFSEVTSQEVLDKSWLLMRELLHWKVLQNRQKS